MYDLQFCELWNRKGQRNHRAEKKQNCLTSGNAIPFIFVIDFCYDLTRQPLGLRATRQPLGVGGHKVAPFTSATISSQREEIEKRNFAVCTRLPEYIQEDVCKVSLAQVVSKFGVDPI